MTNEKIHKKILIEFDIFPHRHVIVYLASQDFNATVAFPDSLPQKGFPGYNFPSVEVVVKDKVV